MALLVRQNPLRQTNQPALQSDGTQQLADVSQDYDSNGNLAGKIDPWGTQFRTGRKRNVRRTNTNTTLVGAETDGTPDDVLLMTVGSKTATLPTPTSANDGQEFTIKNIAGTNTTQTVVGTVDGATNFSLSANNKYVVVVSSVADSGYNIVANN